MLRNIRSITLAALVLTLVAACGGDSTPGSGAGDEVSNLEPGTFEALDIDDCALLTDQEVSDFAGEELVVTQDGPLGCGWVVPGKRIEQFNIRSLRGGGGDSAAAAEVLVNNPEKVIKLDGVGDDAVAVSTYDEVINWVIARQGNNFIVMNQTFLDFDPTPSELDRSAKLAAVAMGRLAELT